jgi:hypothetical protein
MRATAATLDTDYATESTIYVGVAGTVVVVPWKPEGAAAVTFKGLSAGMVVPVRVRSVVAAGTTATDLVRISAEA